jgi:hypothetical protein
LTGDSFDPAGSFVPVDVWITGPLGRYRATFLLDTGSPVTIVDPEVLDLTGYGAHMGTRTSRLAGITSESQDGYRLRIERLEALGHCWAPCEVRCHDLPTDLGVYGLIGMDLLRGHVITIDCVRGVVRLNGDAQ